MAGYHSHKHTYGKEGEGGISLLGLFFHTCDSHYSLVITNLLESKLYAWIDEILGSFCIRIFLAEMLHNFRYLVTKSAMSLYHSKGHLVSLECFS